MHFDSREIEILEYLLKNPLFGIYGINGEIIMERFKQFTVDFKDSYT